MKCPTCHRPEPCESSAECPHTDRRDLLVAERQFLIYSSIVWQEIDRLSEGGTYPGLPGSSSIRKQEKAAWETYRDAMERYGVMVCPRCEGQTYDIGSCSLCENTGYTQVCRS